MGYPFLHAELLHKDESQLYNRYRWSKASTVHRSG